MTEWFSAREAACLVKKAGLTERDLIEWARQGRLSGRAQRGTFSGDDPIEERVFPKEPPLAELERSALGPWPDIPREFWGAPPSKALWGACTFEACVGFWSEYYQSYEYERIELFDVTFNADEIEALLNGRPSTAGTIQPPKERWQKQRVSDRQRVVFEFLELVRNYPQKEPWRPVALYDRYCEEVAKQKTGPPFVWSTFSKFAKRHNDGWRISGSRWTHNP